MNQDKISAQSQSSRFTTLSYGGEEKFGHSFNVYFPGIIQGGQAGIPNGSMDSKLRNLIPISYHPHQTGDTQRDTRRALREDGSSRHVFKFHEKLIEMNSGGKDTERSQNSMLEEAKPQSKELPNPGAGE